MGTMHWRWDQGRLQYFKFENICSIAKVLNQMDGISLNTSDDLLRGPLQANTEMPFLPTHYKVWRNYARVFQCALLATSVDGKLIVTDVCRNLASDNPFSADEYLNFVYSRFRLPFTAFNDYDCRVKPVFPFVAIIKFLIANAEAGITLDDVFEYVIENGCTGTEPVTHYKAIRRTGRQPNGDEKRQVREMMAFMGQSSYIRWFDSKLYIDASNFDAVISSTVPDVQPSRDANPVQEFFNNTSLKKYSPSVEIQSSERYISEFSVREGRKAFASHNKIERSSLLRNRYFKQHTDCTCDICHLLPKEKYPWLATSNVLELHHILPLSATLIVNGTTTTMSDLRPICPTCHRSIHIYYRQKLLEWGLPDFSSRRMAMDVYELAKHEVLL